MSNNRYVKVMFGNKGANFEYKIDEVNVATVWNPNAEKGRDFGGFNYAKEDCILRWLHRGDTLYDVIVPDDAENIKLEGATTIYRTNKIILTNPRKIDDDLALYFYKISNIPKRSYYKALGAVAIMNYKKTALQILRDKVNNDNINDVLEEWNDFINHGGEEDRKDVNETVLLIDRLLNEIKSELLISTCVDKAPYIKVFNDNKIINITGESGSGKSYYTNQYKDNEDYIIIDTDILFSNEEVEEKYIKDLREIILSKFNEELKSILIPHFDECYKIILDYFKGTDKTIVIDSAQYRNLKDISLLKGKIIIMRTSIDTCYERCIERFKNKFPNATEEERDRYIEKKKAIYKWYESLNNFILRVNEY